MKVLHVIPSVSLKRGGPSFAVREMAHAVAACGIEVQVATTDDDGDGHLSLPLEQPIVEQDVTYYYFRRQTSTYAFSGTLTRWLMCQVAEFDILHIHSLFSYSTLSAAWIAHWHCTPYIVRPLGHLNRWGVLNRRSMLKQLSLRLVEHPLLARATLLHFTSEQERVEARTIGVRSPSIVLPLGIDLSPYQALPPAEQFLTHHPHLNGKILLLFLSRLDPKKGVDLLLSAFAQVYRAHPDVALIVAGSGEPAYVAQLQAKAHELGIGQATVWIGFVSGEEKLSVLAAADLFVLPSYSENFGVAVVEALAAGLPVVISDQVGIHQEVAGKKAGLVVPCNDKNLASALVSLVKDPELRKNMGRQGQQLAVELFSQQAMTRGLMKMYEDVLQTKNGQPTG